MNFLTMTTILTIKLELSFVMVLFYVFSNNDKHIKLGLCGCNGVKQFTRITTALCQY